MILIDKLNFGLPRVSLIISIFFNKIGALIPVPQALANASFAANLFARNFALFLICSYSINSFMPKIFVTNLSFRLIESVILLILTISVPMP